MTWRQLRSRLDSRPNLLGKETRTTPALYLPNRTDSAWVLAQRIISSLVKGPR